MTATFKILDWRPMRKNTLLGFAKSEMPSGMIMADISVLMGNNGPWASPPGKPMIGRDGIVMKDDRGKIRYSPFIEFASKESRDRFSNAVIEALRKSNPEAFE